jgi:glycosyltransferase involved in cell wall biosynthesis
MPNVLHIINCLSVGGAQKALLNLLSSEISASYPPCVVTLTTVDGLQAQFAQAGIRVHEMGVKTPAGILLFPWRLWRIVRDVRPAIIHGWQYHGNLAALLAWLLAGRHPCLLWGIHHTPDRETFKTWRHAAALYPGKWLSPWADRILYVSRRSQQRHHDLGYAGQHDGVIPNGVALLPAQVEDRERMRQEWGIPAGVPVIGSLTRFVPAKDIPGFVAAIRQFLDMGKDACFVLAGEGMDAANPKLKTLLGDAGVAGKVRLLGVRQDAARVIAAMDIATLSSAREALPLFVVEAMAAGVPCVATDVGDIAECMADTGSVVPPADPFRLARAWADMLALPVAERQALGQAAQRRVRGMYSLDRVVRAYRELFAEVCG